MHGGYNPYYQQPVYPQTPYMGAGSANQQPPNMGYPPFYGPSNPQLAPPNPNLPMPYPYDAASKYPQGTVIPSQGASSRPHRRQTLPSQPLGNGGGTLKSAMKRTMNVFTNAETAISRQISNPFNNQQTPPTSATHNNPRPRLYSNPAPPQGLVTKDEVFEPDSPPCKLLSLFSIYRFL